MLCPAPLSLSGSGSQSTTSPGLLSTPQPPVGTTVESVPFSPSQSLASVIEIFLEVKLSPPLLSPTLPRISFVLFPHKGKKKSHELHSVQGAGTKNKEQTQGPNSGSEGQSLDPLRAPQPSARLRSPRAPPCDVTVPTMVLKPRAAGRTGKARAGNRGAGAGRQPGWKPARRAAQNRAGAARRAGGALSNDWSALPTRGLGRAGCGKPQGR